MNTKFLTVASLLIASLCHLVLFNLCIIVFPIDPASPKPNFFFLGPILKQNDLLRPESQNNDIPPGENFLKPRSQQEEPIPMPFQPVDNAPGPFIIGPIKKPLKENQPDGQQKTLIKSTFDSELKAPPSKEGEQQPGEPEMMIPPYKPLQFRIR